MINVQRPKRKPKNKRNKQNSQLYNQRPKSCLSWFGTGAPDEFRLKLCYAQEFNLTSAGFGATQQFRGNSVYDPDFTGVGDQPLYYSQWQTIYERFRVHGSKITLRAVASVQPGVHLAISANPDTSTIGSVTTLANISSQRVAQNKYVCVGAKETVFVMECSTPFIFGMPRNAVDTDDTLQGTISSDPAKTWCWQITALVTDKVSTVTVYCNMCIEYDVTLYDRILVTQ